jgi:hypothetical protein
MRASIGAVKKSSVPSEQVTPCDDANKAQFAARLWCRRVAFEVANDMPEAERDACERFCLRHRLSILAAFHRRLARADVVRAMRGLYHAGN